MVHKHIMHLTAAEAARVVAGAPKSDSCAAQCAPPPPPLVCAFTSVDGVDGFCPPPDFKEIVAPKSASDDAEEHEDAVDCWELAQTDPDCVNKDTVSFDYTTGQCLCDTVRARPGRLSALGVP